MTAKPSIALLLTGNELMSGDTVDSNSAVIAQQFGEQGLAIAEKVTVGDHRTRLLGALQRLTHDHQIVVVNGGLGPTEDDLTAEVIAEMVGVQLVEHPDARRHVIDWCKNRGFQAKGANLKQAWLPQGCSLLHNPRGSALGFIIHHQDALVVTTPGVPGELRAMLPALTEHCLEYLGPEAQDNREFTLKLQTFGLGESTIQEILREEQPNWPEEVSVGFRSGLPLLEVKLTVHTTSSLPLRSACHERLIQRFGDHIIGIEETTLPRALQIILRAQHKTLVTAESCTGGLIASMITAEPGASDVFHAGYVTYANHIKQTVLGVGTDTLNQHGAVSEPVVRQMLIGALEQSGADVGIAVSGIAGPGGGTPDKPVGTVWIAWGTAKDPQACRVQIPGPRSVFQTLTAAAGLDLVRRHLLGLPSKPWLLTRQDAGKV